MIELADVFRSYQTYLHIFETSPVVGKDGVQGLPASFSEFCGVYGDGTKRGAIWDGDRVFWEMGTGIQSSSSLLRVDSSTSRQGGAGAGLIPVEVECSTRDANEVAASSKSSSIEDTSDTSKRGPNWERNNRRRLRQAERKKAKRAEGALDPKVPEWRRNAKANSHDCPSLSASVRTVDTRTAVEIEAAETLAARRVVENKLAIVKGNKLLKSFDNKSKSEAVEILEIARMESRINEAKLRSQRAYGKCDRSLKSVSSALSAGEFAMKKTAAENAELRSLVNNLQQQVKVAMKHATGKAFSELAAIPDVRKVSIRDVMGDPTDKWTMRETNAYYSILNAEAQGDYETPWEDFLR